VRVQRSTGARGRQRRGARRADAGRGQFVLPGVRGPAGPVGLCPGAGGVRAWAAGPGGEAAPVASSVHWKKSCKPPAPTTASSTSASPASKPGFWTPARAGDRYRRFSQRRHHHAAWPDPPTGSHGEGDRLAAARRISARTPSAAWGSACRAVSSSPRRAPSVRSATPIPPPRCSPLRMGGVVPPSSDRIVSRDLVRNRCCDSAPGRPSSRRVTAPRCHGQAERALPNTVR
jgi:hypothetical protein